jgi:PAS domain S-box-containing protein
MSKNNFTFSNQQFERIFPFYLLLDEQLRIISFGKSAAKAFSIEGTPLFNSLFKMLRPLAEVPSLNLFKQYINQIVIIESLTENKITLRGNIEWLEAESQLLFIGSPWYGIIDNDASDILQKEIVSPDTKKEILKSSASNGINEAIDNINQAKVELAKKVHQFQGLSGNIPGVIFEYECCQDGSYMYRYLSPAMEKIFGIKPANIFKLTQFIHPEDLLEMEATLAKASDTLAPFYLESRLILPGRGMIWRSLSCSFSYYSETGAKVFTGLMLDISEKKKADEKLNESENRLSSLIANLQTGILVEDENRQLVLTNELYCKMFDLDCEPDEIKNLDCADIVDQTKELFKDPEFYSERIVSLLEFQQLAVDDILELKDGRIFSRDFIPIYNNNLYKGHLWKFTDVTTEKNTVNSLRISEEKYRSIIANMNLGLLEVDTDENIMFANQCFCDMCGYDLDELIGRRAAQIFIKGANIELMERKNEERKKGTAGAYEIVVKNKRGQVRWWLVSGAPRYDENGELLGTIGIHLDITEQKELEYELTIAREQAEQSTQSKEVFLANMSHEIRTPMNAILGMSNQLAKTHLNTKQLFYLDTINSASENLLVIINDILDLSKIEAGKLSLEKIAFEPQSVVKRAMQVLSHKAEEKGLVLTNTIFDESVSPVLMGDPYRLNQVMLNVITNAIKFTERGSIDISLEMLKDSKDSQLLRISVTDTGIGMDDQFVKNLFEKFSQEDASVTRQYGGTGLGMSICKELVELMGGMIKAKSKKGKGSVIYFEVTFPKGDIADLPSKDTFIVNESMLAGKIILVVDDNEMNRLVATTILNNYGAETVESANGKESVDYLTNNKVDLVLMDVQMPVMNGFEATDLIRRSISRSLPIIALTANAIKGDNEKCLDAGMNDYMSKPFKEEDLLKKIAKLLFITVTKAEITTKEISMTPICYYDISEIKTISRGNDEFVKKMLKMFIEQAPAHISEMKSKFIANEFIGVGEIAHRIKPTIDNMGIASLKTTIREIEKIGKSGQDNGSLPMLMEKVEMDISSAINAIKNDYQLA